MPSPARKAAPMDVFVPADFLLRSAAAAIDVSAILLAQVALGLLSTLGLPDGLVGLLQAGVSAGYFTWMVAARNGQTLGKRVAAIAVVREDGGPVGYGRAFGRYLAWLLSIVSAGVGFLLALRGAKRRALHDYLAGTRVICAKELEERRRKVLVIVGAAAMPAALAFLLASSGPDLPPQRRSPYADAGALGERLPFLRSLESLRSAAAAYAGSHDGAFPEQIADLLPARGIDELPAVELPDHGAQEGAQAYGAAACAGDEGLDGSRLQDTGKWGYVSDGKAACRGLVFIDCTHTDPAGTEWFRY